MYFIPTLLCCVLSFTVFPLGNAYSQYVLVHVILLLDHVNLIHDVCLHY